MKSKLTKLNLTSDALLTTVFKGLRSGHKIKLSNKNLTIDDLKKLCDILNYFPNCESIDLEKNNLSGDGLDYITPGLRFIKDVRHIVLSDNNLNSNDIDSFSTSLFVIPNLQKLELTCIYILL